MIRVKVASPVEMRMGRFIANNPRAAIGAARGVAGAAVGAGVGAAAAGPGNRMTGAAGGALAGGALGAGSSALVGQKGLSTVRAAGQELSADAAQRIMRGPKLGTYGQSEPAYRARRLLGALMEEHPSGYLQLLHGVPMAAVGAGVGGIGGALAAPEGHRGQGALYGAATGGLVGGTAGSLKGLSKGQDEVAAVRAVGQAMRNPTYQNSIKVRSVP